MAELIEKPTRRPVPGGKIIDEYVAICLPAFAPELFHREEVPEEGH